ncbi:DUF1461 domain-containing protein [Alteromonas sp. 5E99-2]|uniref:lipoprotein intramolecular transacylase Lit n=1 Tax=Alteromonas sp. 5E99-2 TaxID=2817683 RepID=UPI001A98420B|nr:DUF1461 domain-containing protein [Alteromonas sp. 5E99-2]MBO1256381.1 DUF1461 domain-containing protein [Alteromonas sp. 5E99-2]
MFVLVAISWFLLYQSNFLYGFWHDHGGIQQKIERYAPQNRNIKGFENTSKIERTRVFKRINYAVHIDKTILSTITFITKDDTEKTLLTQDEILHLEDVANLIRILYYFMVVMVLLWAYLLAKHIKSYNQFPSLLGQTKSVGGFIGVIGLSVIFVGPTKAFYWLHDVIFPDNHKWFFYYQDSLMSTLMAAPDLFGWIAIEWVLLFSICFYFMHLGLKKLHFKMHIQHTSAN